MTIDIESDSTFSEPDCIISLCGQTVDYFGQAAYSAWEGSNMPVWLIILIIGIIVLGALVIAALVRWE